MSSGCLSWASCRSLKEADSTPENALLHNSVPSGFAEAFRTIRTSVLFSSAEEGGRSAAATSTGPGEGKTLVSTNLAVALAQAGQRVLLVDGDMRKPRVHQVFDQKVGAGPLELTGGELQGERRGAQGARWRTCTCSWPA